jgi:small subunit ribosomal protein S19
LLDKYKQIIMTRSVWKGPYTRVNSEDQVIWSRASIITPEWVGRKVSIHNGKIFISLQVTQDMIGHRWGEFASTRKRAQHRRTTR